MTEVKVKEYNSFAELPAKAADATIAVVKSKDGSYQSFIFQVDRWVPIKPSTELGATLYELNKSGMANAEPMTKEQIEVAKVGLHNFVTRTGDFFYMLLNNRDMRYYTVFAPDDGPWDGEFGEPEKIEDEIILCLQHLGEILAIDANGHDDQCEIWIKHPDLGPIAFYFFPYDIGVAYYKWKR